MSICLDCKGSLKSSPLTPPLPHSLPLPPGPLPLCQGMHARQVSTSEEWGLSGGGSHSRQPSGLHNRQPSGLHSRQPSGTLSPQRSMNMAQQLDAELMLQASGNSGDNQEPFSELDQRESLMMPTKSALGPSRTRRFFKGFLLGFY